MAYILHKCHKCNTYNIYIHGIRSVIVNAENIFKIPYFNRATWNSFRFGHMRHCVGEVLQQYLHITVVRSNKYLGSGCEGGFLSKVGPAVS